MIRRTLKNMERATRMIADKGYKWNEANEMAINCFDLSEYSGISVEFYIAKIKEAAR
ncbi:hypothetical protein LY85_3322 [Clostridium sp. KNHs216]|nr:hypothetical protein LY85_3322 [Clostridium sp. KNHs216]